MKNKFKQETGSMAAYTIAMIMTFMIILGGIYFSNSALRKNQLKTLREIKDIYEEDTSKVDEINEALKKQKLDTSKYVKTGLIAFYDGINNTGNSHDPNTTVWKDLSGNGNDGTLVNMSASEVSGWQNDGLRLDGIDDYVNIDPSKLINLTKATICIDFELYDWSTEQQYNTLFFKGNGVGWNNNHIQISKNYNSTNEFNTTISNNTSSTAANLKTPIQLNTHKQIVLQWDGSQVKNYDNGKLNGTISSTILPADNSTVCYLGKGYNDIRFLNCKIKSLKIYNRALTQEEINQNYAQDKIRYEIKE